MKKCLCCLSLVLVVASLQGVLAGKSAGEMASKAQKKRQKIDSIVRELYGKAHGYAVFSNLKISLALTGAGGTGVAVDKASKRRTYMKMGTAGLNLGLGG
jgi:hypothetical protein